MLMYFILLMIILVVFFMAMMVWGILFNVMCDFIQERFWVIGSILISIPELFLATLATKTLVEIFAEYNLIL